MVINTVNGTVERCPSCQGFFAPWDMLAKFSENPDAFLASLVEIQPQLFPTGRICPHCLGRLSQGRLPNQDVIISLCVSCKLIWTSPADLESFDPLMAQAVRTQIQTPGVSAGRRIRRKSMEPPPDAPVEENYFPGYPKQPPPEIPPFDPVPPAFDRRRPVAPPSQDLEKELREGWLKREAELSKRHAEELQKARETLDQTLREKLTASEMEQAQRLSSLQKNIADLEKGRAEQQSHLDDLKARMEATFHEKFSAVKSEYADFVGTLQKYIESLEKTKLGQENDIRELKNRLEMLEKQRIAQPPKDVPAQIKPEIKEPPVPTPTPPPVKTSLPVGRLPTPATTPAEPPMIPPTPAPAPAPVPVPVPIPKPVITAPKPAPVIKPALLANVMAQVKTFFASRPKKTAAPKPVPAPAPLPKPAPIEKKPILAEKKPAEVEEKPKPAEEIKPEPVAKPKRKSFFEELKSAWQPLPKKPSLPADKPALPVKEQPPVPTPMPKPALVAAKPIPVQVPAVVPKETTPKKKVAWLDRVIVWMPRIVPVIVFLIDGAIDEDWGQAFLWAAGAWGICAMIRMWRTYSSAFQETTLTQLEALPETSLKGGVPVRMKGRLIIQEPGSKKLQFKDATGLIALNILSPIDILPRLFGLISSGQYPQDEFELTGWYRRDKTPFIEVAQARHEKMIRKSFVKPLRWASAAVALFFAILLLFVIE